MASSLRCVRSRRDDAAPRRSAPRRVRHEAVHAGLRGLGRPAGHVRRDEEVVQPDELRRRVRSLSYTSRPAPAMRPSRSAAMLASVSTTLPRPMLTRKPCGPSVEHLRIDRVARRRAAGRGAHEEVAPPRQFQQAAEVAVQHQAARCGCDNRSPGRSRRRVSRSSARWCPGRRCASFLPETFGGCGITSRQMPSRHWRSSMRMPHDADSGQGVVGHAVVVGAGAVGGGDAAGAQHVHRQALEAGAQAAPARAPAWRRPPRA